MKLPAILLFQGLSTYQPELRWVRAQVPYMMANSEVLQVYVNVRVNSTPLPLEMNCH